MNRLHVAVAVAVSALCSLGGCETPFSSDAGTGGGGGSSLFGGGTGGGGFGHVGGGIGGGGGQAPVADAGSTTSWVLVSGTGPVRVYALDLTTGALVPKGLADAGLNPSFLAVDPARRSVYAVNEGGVNSTVSALSFNSKTGALTPLNSTVVGSGPAHLAVDPTGAWVLAANYNGGSVVAVPVRPTGGVGAVKTTVQPGSQPHQVVIDSSTHSAFVPCKGSDSVAQYRFEPDGGILTPLAPPTISTASGAGPRHLALHPNGAWAYLVNEVDSTLTSLSVTNGRLTPIETHSTLPIGYSGPNTGAEVLVHPSGKWVYASNRGHDSIVQFQVDQATGTLDLVGHTSTLGQSPRCFAIDPTGRVMLVANQNSSTVKTFFLDAGVPVSTGHDIEVDSPAYVGVILSE